MIPPLCGRCDVLNLTLCSTTRTKYRLRRMYLQHFFSLILFIKEIIAEIAGVYSIFTVERIRVRQERRSVSSLGMRRMSSSGANTSSTSDRPSAPLVSIKPMQHLGANTPYAIVACCPTQRQSSWRLCCYSPSSQDMLRPFYNPHSTQLLRYLKKNLTA
jgi:hypothetical protein